jgi:transcriptional regulator
MYNPDHFIQTDTQQITDLIAAYPLAALVCCGDAGLVVNHIPLIMDGPDRLIGHIAKANSLHLDIPDGGAAVAVFTGQDSYISPNWYPTKADQHEAVPTWNYRVVHVHGTLHFSHNDKDKRAVVGKLTKRQEGADGWRMADAPAPYMANMIDNIVAMTLHITRIEAKDKLGQNRQRIDFDAVQQKMAETGKDAMAKAMQGYQTNDQ